MLSVWKYPFLWHGCINAWAASAEQQPANAPALVDFSPFGNDGLLTNIDPLTDYVVSGGRLALNFNSSQDTYVGNTTFATQQLQNVSGFTVAAWCKSSDPDALKGIVCSSLTAAVQNGDFYLHQLNGSGGRWRWIVHDGVSKIATTAIPLTVTTDWTHICGVYDNGSLRLYVNGRLGASSAGTGTFSQKATNELMWGRFYRLNTSFDFDGYIDDSRIFSRALSPAEIEMLATRRGVAFERVELPAIAATGGDPVQPSSEVYLDQGQMRPCIPSS